MVKHKSRWTNKLKLILLVFRGKSKSKSLLWELSKYFFLNWFILNLALSPVECKALFFFYNFSFVSDERFISLHFFLLLCWRSVYLNIFIRMRKTLGAPWRPSGEDTIRTAWMRSRSRRFATGVFAVQDAAKLLHHIFSVTAL